MKFPEFNHAKKQWDLHKRFYVYDGMYTLFEDGDLYIYGSDFKPNVRYSKNSNNITVRLTREASAEGYRFSTTKGGEPVKTAELLRGGTTKLLIDHDRGVAVNLEGSYRSDPPLAYAQRFGEHKRPAPTVWYPREGSLPVPRFYSVLGKRDKEEERRFEQWLRDVSAIIKVASLDGSNNKRGYSVGLYLWDLMGPFKNGVSTSTAAERYLSTDYAIVYMLNNNNPERIVENFKLQIQQTLAARSSHEYLYVV